jgi:hypothetical protein
MMRHVVLLGMLLSAIPLTAQATALVCRGWINQEWGYLTITTEDGIECIITRRVGMQTVVSTCGDKRCKVTGVFNGQQSTHQYIDGLIAVEVDPLQWGHAQVEAAP